MLVRTLLPAYVRHRCGRTERSRVASRSRSGASPRSDWTPTIDLALLTATKTLCLTIPHPRDSKQKPETGIVLVVIHVTSNDNHRVARTACLLKPIPRRFALESPLILWTRHCG